AGGKKDGDEMDVDRERHQLDRHHDDDDVLAVEEDAEHACCEQDRGDRQVMLEAHRHRGHSPAPWACGPRTCSMGAPPPSGTLTTAIVSARRRASCSGIRWRRTPTRCRRVRTIAPIIATRRTRPAA